MREKGRHIQHNIAMILLEHGANKDYLLGLGEVHRYNASTPNLAGYSTVSIEASP